MEKKLIANMNDGAWELKGNLGRGVSRVAMAAKMRGYIKQQTSKLPENGMFYISNEGITFKETAWNMFRGDLVFRGHLVKSSPTFQLVKKNEK